VREKRSIPVRRAFYRYTVATAVRPMPLTLPAPLLRLRSDEQLLALFRAGREDAFRAIHDRYHERLLAYVGHMLRGHSEAEDVVQDVFLRAYGALRTGEREIAVRPWLYRVAHNRCIDYVRRAPAAPLEPDELLPGGIDPVAAAEQREDLRRLVSDLHALPEQQRSALIIRELEGLSYDDLATTLGVTVPAVKSLLVRARTGLAEAGEARDTDCGVIREQLALAVDRPGRPPRLLRDHLRECSPCRAHRQALRHGHAQLASLLPGPSTLLLGGWLASLIGSGGATSAAAGSSIAAGATKALAVASASVAVAGGAAEVAVHAHLPARHHSPAVTATAMPRVHTIRVAATAAGPPVTPPAPAPAPRAEQVIDAAPSPGSGPVAAGPAIEQDDEPAATPAPTATPEPTPTPDATTTPEATATPEPVPTAETATEATATPTAPPSP
jgi:RNA polymerase sigma factor (sigma-70 family)